jgi:hypothetical protein
MLIINLWKITKALDDILFLQTEFSFSSYKKNICIPVYKQLRLVYFDLFLFMEQNHSQVTSYRRVFTMDFSFLKTMNYNFFLPYSVSLINSG